MAQGPVGQSVVRADAKEKVTGEQVYCADLNLPQILHGRVLRSRYPHARILSIQTSAARALAGVVAVVVAADVPGVNLMGRDGDQPVLCSDKVRFVGDAVAAVVAESPEVAAKAIELIEVEYQSLPAVFDAKEAMQDGAPRVHEDKENLLRHFELRKGDVELAWSACDVIIENSYTTPLVEHAYLETEAAVAIKNPDATITVWAPTQFAHLCREHVAIVLGLAPEQVRVVNTNAGGGFGGKGHEFDCVCRAALLAYLTGRPVKLVYDRQESIISSPKRHAMTIEYKTGATKDGRVQAVQVRAYMNKGPYGGVALEPGSPILRKPGQHGAGPYDIPNVRIDVYSIYTNLLMGGAMRGFGVPQVAFAHESQMDELAHRLGMDPVEIRLLNGLEIGSRTATNELLRCSVGLKETIVQAAEKAGWKQFHASTPRNSSGKILRGMGIAAFMYTTDLGNVWRDYANCTMELDSTGHIVVRTGLAEMGQGSRAAFTQMAAQALGVPLEYVVAAKRGDTAVDPESMSTVASRTTFAGGNAIIRAAADARQTLFEMAADSLDLSVEQVAQTEDGFREVDGSRTVSLHDVLLYCQKSGRRQLGKGWWSLPRINTPARAAIARPIVYGAQIAEVAVDTETGRCEVERVIHAQDVGKAINPGIVHAQMQGGIAMALGHTLTEEVVVKEGYVSNASLAGYLVPTAMDIPPLELIIVEDSHPNGPFGAKGVGEPGTVATAAAIANAVFDAVGVRIRTLPVTAERLWMALQEKKVKQSAAGALS